MFSSDVPQLHTQHFNNSSAEVTNAFSLSAEGTSLKYDESGKYIAVCTYNGNLYLYSCSEKKITHEYNDPHEIPMTCLKWRPETNFGSKVIGVANGKGYFSYVHVPSMKRLFTVHEPQNQIMCCDFDGIGKQFATSGQDSNIRIYDEDTKDKKALLQTADTGYPGHSNKIFSVKFIDKNTLISGGWDKTVQIWDLRQERSVASVYGYKVGGDSIDYRESQILVGCYEEEKPINIFDSRKMKPLETIGWGQDRACVYTCSFHPFDKKSIIAGAFGPNEVRIFSGETKHLTGTRIFDLRDGCYSVGGNPLKRQIAISTTKKHFYLYSYETQ